MPLSPPAPRKHLHKRTYEMNGYIREDGLWDIEGHIRDEKSYGFDNAWRGRVDAGDAVHDMSIRLTVDDDFVIQAIEATTDAGPYSICPDITPNFQKMVGAKVGPGWRKTVRQRLGGVHGCTHLVELLISMATVTYQTAYSSKAETGKTRTAVSHTPGRRPVLIDSCYAYRSDGPVVEKQFPEYFTGGTSDAAD